VAGYLLREDWGGGKTKNCLNGMTDETGNVR